MPAFFSLHRFIAQLSRMASGGPVTISGGLQVFAPRPSLWNEDCLQKEEVGSVSREEKLPGVRLDCKQKEKSSVQGSQTRE